MTLLQQLPDEVKDVIYADENPAINSAIAENFHLSQAQLEQIFPLLIKVFTREMPVLDFPVAMSHLNLPNVDTRALALEFALKRLWPLQAYLKEVDRLIIRLGGEVPKVVPKLGLRLAAAPASEAEEQGIMTTAKEYLSGSAQRKSFLLTRESIIDADKKLQPPTVENWIKDFLHFTGAGISDAFLRSAYLVHSDSAKKLPEADKNNLLNFLISYGENRSMRFTLEGQYLTVAPIVTSAEQAVQRQQAAAAVDLDQAIADYHRYVGSLQSQINGQREALKVETGDQAVKLIDILWNAIGLGERERALGSLAVLAEQRLLLELLKSDQRFIGIMRRFINVRFGDRAKTSWQPTTITVGDWSLFFQLILAEKMGLKPAEAAMTGEYLSELMGLKNKPVYLDLMRGQFRFREVKFEDKQLAVI